MCLLNCNTDAHMQGRNLNDATKIIEFPGYLGECFNKIAYAIRQIILNEPMLTGYNFRTECYLIAELEQGVSYESWIAAAAKVNQMNEFTHFVLECRHADSMDYLYGRIEIRKEVLKVMRGRYLSRYGNVRDLMRLLNRSVTGTRS
jgi:hypothetical protein